MQTIDCSANPFVPEGFQLIRHDRNGLLEWEPTNEQEQCPGKLSYWFFPRWNANVLDALLASPSLIPPVWGKRTLLHPFGRTIYFGGTLYLSPHRHESIRYLHKCGEKGWMWGYEWVDY